MEGFYMVCFCLLSSSMGVHSMASFYGQSFIYKAIDSKPADTTIVNVQFYTSSSDGTILLGLGRTQYLHMALVQGRAEVHIDLGYGEEVLSTPYDVDLNNLIWHTLKLVKSGKNAKLVLNERDVDHVELIAPDRSRAKFDADFGVFVGGLGGNITISDGSKPKFFRGCLLTAEFNGLNLIHVLDSEKNETVVSNVFSGCPSIFRASTSEPFTFDSPLSFIALKRWTVLDQGIFECSIKTTEKDGIILYNTGRNRGEFIGLEMVDGKLGASVNRGSGVVGLRTTTSINDGLWHSIKFSFSPSFLDIRVDGNRTKTYFEQQTPLASNSATISQQHHSLYLTGNLYVGGVPQNLLHNGEVPHSLLSLSIVDGIATVGGAFPGCIKNIRVNHRKKSFQDFISTHQVKSGCSLAQFSSSHSGGMSIWEAGAVISDLYAEFFKQASTTTTTTTRIVTTTQTTIPTTPEFVLPTVRIALRGLNVLEGGSAIISNHEIVGKLIPGSLNVTEEDILLVITDPAAHGYLSLSETCQEPSITEFSLIDIASRRLSYCHDGSETMNDNIEFSVVLSLIKKTDKQKDAIISHIIRSVKFLSSGIILNDRDKYDVPIAISPTDDAPQLEIPLDYLFKPIKNVPTHFSNSILNATDVDSNRKDIMYSVLGNMQSVEFTIQDDEYPDRSITEFSQEDLDSDKISFTHRGHRDNSRLFLRIFNPSTDDGYAQRKHTSVVLRIAAQPLNITASVKGIDLLERSAVIITDDHLSVSVNAEPESVDLTCHVERKPSLGILELKKSMNLWQEADNFTLLNIQNGEFRYRNTRRTALRTRVDSDSFAFTVSAVGIQSAATEFPISVEKVNIDLELKGIILDNGIQEALLSVDNINVRSDDIVLSADRLQIRLKNFPKHVDLLFNDNELVLGANGTFTYQELKRGRVSVRVKTKFAARSFQELIELEATANDLYDSNVQMMNVTYVPDLDRIVLLMKELVVDEGREISFGIRTLKSSLPPSPTNLRIKQFRFQVTQAPAYGILGIKGRSKEDTDQENIEEFLSTDLEKNALFYRHDGSETISDQLAFQVRPVLDGQLPQTIAKLSSVYAEANFTIKINPVNDQRPYRVVNRIFEIVKNGERLLTKDDLWYHDDDSEYDNLDLMIRIRGNTNGDILNATNRRHEKIDNFTQRQILNNEVLFKHKRLNYGRFVFWVLDENSKHFSTGLMTVSASDPYLRIVNSTNITVIKGKNVVIDNVRLACITNVKGLREDIKYSVTKGPENGLLYLNKSSEDSTGSLSSFTQKDINDDLLVYEHSGSPVMSDEFLFTVTVGTLTKIGNMSIRVYLESHSKPPTVQKNRTVTVLQGKRVQIRKQDLRVVHPDAKAQDILFIIVESPRFGDLVFLSDVESDEFNSHSVTEFTQSDINHGSVWYAQNDSFMYTDGDFVNGLLLDSFRFNVTNQIMTVPDLQFFFDIVAKVIPLRISNFSVREGHSKAMIHDFLWIEGSHFETDDVEIRIVHLPQHGIFESTRQIGAVLKSFNYQLAVEEFIYYAHDGSDFIRDNFSLQAFTLNGEKESMIMNGFINIIPENDETPVVVNNTGLKVWTNSVTMISSSHLSAYDPDSSPKKVRFRVLPASNGFITLSDDPTSPISNFTQKDINDGRIVFVHNGDTTGGFTFQCDDGVNYANKHIFVVTAQPLVIIVQKPKTIQVFPEMHMDLTSHILYAETNDVEFPNRMITYIITTPPAMGKLIKKNDVSSVRDENGLFSFTQKEISDGVVQYYQDAELKQWSASDSFVLLAFSPPAQNISDIKIAVNITYDAIEGRSPIRHNEGVNVDEGGKVAVNTSCLDASNLFKKLPPLRDRKPYQLIYSILKVPKHGNLSISGKNVTKVNTTFSQVDLATNKIYYMHDHSDTLKDTFHLKMYLIDKRYSSSTGSHWIVPGTEYEDYFNVTINPLNDNPPTLLTKGKILHVVDGYRKLITTECLNSSDPDSSPDEIIFSIIKQPSKGSIVYSDDPGKMLTKFSQEDVVQRRIIFKPNPLNLTEEVEDVFYFGITDGIQRPAYSFFKMKIHPVIVSFSPGVMEIAQGSLNTILSTEYLNVSTNGNLSLVSFRVTWPALMGLILVNDEQSALFTYEDVLDKRVSFTLTSNDSPNDTLELTVNFITPAGMNLTSTDMIQVKVKPLMKIPADSFNVSNNGLTRIGLSVLDASPLLDKTDSTPIYYVLKKPTEGKLVVATLLKEKSRRKRDLDDFSTVLIETSRFSHTDVSDGRLFIHNEVTNATGSDSMKLRLSVEDHSVPPADFILSFDVTNAKPEDFTEFLNGFLPTPEVVTTIEMPPDDLFTTGSQMRFNTTMKKNVYGTTTTRSHSNFFNKGKGNVEVTSIRSQDVHASDPKVGEAAISWWIPVAVSCGILLLLVVILAIIFTRRRCSPGSEKYSRQHKISDENDENSALTKQESFQYKRPDCNQATKIENSSPQALHSPACPGVTVTLLQNDSAPDATESLLPSVFGRTDDAPSYLPSTCGPNSIRDGQHSTLYSPSTVYRYDDVGSMDFTDGADTDFYNINHTGYPTQRLYHARSDKFIDPDVLALYSSDESIPSMLDEKYAISYNNGNGFTGSVPSELHRAITPHSVTQEGIPASRSTASLSKAANSTELSLPPNAGLDSNQYWI